MKPEKISQATLDIQQVMQTQHGRRFVWAQMQSAGMNKSSMASSPHDLAFNEGQRNAGLRLAHCVSRASPNEWVLMHVENLVPKKSDQHIEGTKDDLFEIVKF